MSADVTANDEASSTARVSVEQRRRSDQRRWRYTHILVALSLFALIFGVPVVSLYLHRLQRDTSIVELDPNETPGLYDTIKNAVSGINSKPDETASDTDLAKINLELRLAAFDMEFAQARQTLRHLESAKAEWTKLLESTLHDTVGKRIAGNEELFLRFIALRRLPAPEPVAQDVTVRLSDIRHEVKTLENDADSLDRLLAATEETKRHVSIAFAFHQARVDQLQAIRESAASLPASDFELSAAVSMRAAALTNKLNSAAEEAARELEESLKRELTQLKQQRDDGAKLVTQLKLQLARVANGESLDTSSDIQDVQSHASRKDFERELKRIHTDLVAFTTPGYVQPESADNLVYHRAKRPFSYSALQRIGALEDSENGRAILLRVGGSKTATQQNDRPLGNFPRMNSISELRKPEIVARLKESQRLLRQYGLMMVEDGLLSP